jgi:Uncharacterized protein conserved in bacteria
MSHFIGSVDAKADTKGRLFIPAQFRKQLQTLGEEKLIMKKDVFQKCLTLSSESEWGKDLAELQAKLNKWNAKHQLILRQFVSDVEIIIPDSNGRILIPKRYMQMAEIEADVTFIGVSTKIEIWAKGKEKETFMEPEVFGAELEKIMQKDLMDLNDE